MTSLPLPIIQRQNHFLKSVIWLTLFVGGNGNSLSFCRWSFYHFTCQFHTILSFLKVSFYGFKTFTFFFGDLCDWFLVILVILVCSSKASDVNDLMFADIQAHSLLDFSIIFPSLTWQIRTGMGWCGKQAKSLTISPSVCNHKYFQNVEHLDGVVCLSCQILEDGKSRDALSGVMHWHPHLFNIFMGVANNYESDEWTRPRHSTMIYVFFLNEYIYIV